MKNITKKEEPVEFKNWKENEETKCAIKRYTDNKDAQGLWDYFPSSPEKEDKKDLDINYYSRAELKEYIASEQGYICCYCNCEIKEDLSNSNIEHLIPKSTNINLTLSYENLALSCRTNETCNQKRGNIELPILPTNPNCELSFRYQLDGKVNPNYKENQEEYKPLEKMIEDTLNLNNTSLKLDRKQVIEGYIFDSGNTLSSEDLENIKNKLSEKNKKDDKYKYKEFCCAIISCINQLS